MFNVNFADDWIRTTLSEAIALSHKHSRIIYSVTFITDCHRLKRHKDNFTKDATYVGAPQTKINLIDYLQMY